MIAAVFQQAASSRHLLLTVDCHFTAYKMEVSPLANHLTVWARHVKANLHPNRLSAESSITAASDMQRGIIWRKAQPCGRYLCTLKSLGCAVHLLLQLLSLAFSILQLLLYGCLVLQTACFHTLSLPCHRQPSTRGNSELAMKCLNQGTNAAVSWH